MSKKNQVKNVPSYASKYPYWVVSIVDGELWFWNGYKTRDAANLAITENRRDDQIILDD